MSLSLPPTLRFTRYLKHAPTGESFPVMIALVTDVDDLPIGIHRTWLAHDGRGKAPVAQPKMSLGPVAGGAIRLAPFDPSQPLMIGEGIETCLSAMMSGGQAWSAISAGNLARSLRLPPAARDVVILADNDPAGERSVNAAVIRWRAEGRRVRIARPPPPFNDFNDLLLGRAPKVSS
jgi:hypothetical protein